MLSNSNINPPASNEAETPTSANSGKFPPESCRPYKERLNCWAIVRIESTGDQIVDLFRSHSDALGHLHLLQQKFPTAKFRVVFEKQEL